MELYIALGVFAFLMLVCLLSSKLSSYINMPCLLLFLGVGMLAGSEGIGGIEFDNAAAANYIGSAAMAFILFAGGFDTSWKSVKSVFLPGGILSSLGVLLTALSVGFFTWGILKVIFPEQEVALSWCLLLGSIISSTDAAAVFAILRSKSVSLSGKLQPLLEFESGSNDPMAAFLTIFMVSVVSRESLSGEIMPILSYWVILPTFLFKMTIGIVVGWGIGKLCVWLYNKINFDYDGLYYVLSIVAVLFAYSIPELLQGNGFMAVYVAGMVMGNYRFVFCRGVGRFYDGLAWIMQVVLFSMLGLLAFPSQVWEAKYLGMAVAIFLMFVARPLATFICLIKSEFSLREKIFISWVGLRGGAPIMLATFPMMGGIANSALMFHIVFFIVITSVLLQGMTLMPLAKLLKLDAPLRKKPRTPLAFEETMDANAESYEFAVCDDFDGKTIAQANFPAGLLVLLIKRDAQILVPRGETKLQRGDVLTVLGNQAAIKYCKTMEA